MSALRWIAMFLPFACVSHVAQKPACSDANYYAALAECGARVETECKGLRAEECKALAECEAYFDAWRECR